MSGNLTRRSTRETHPRPRSRWPRVRSLVGTVVILALSLFALLTIVIPHVLGAQTYTVLTGSMQPGMPPGTMIAVRAASIDDVRVGDVVTYQIRSGDPAVVTHRVVGTTSSTGGERLLVTRGDANDVDDPPVQREQLRGTVIMAVPYLGYPGVLLGGHDRGAIVAVVGIVIVGYGISLLVVDLLRTRRRRAAAATLAVLVAVAALTPFLTPAPARAGEPGTLSSAAASRDAAEGNLQLSADGIRFVSDGSLDPIDDLGRLAPGITLTTPVWIRNVSSDPARAAVRLDLPGADGTRPTLAGALRLAVDDQTVAPGAEWRSAVIPAGGTVRIAIGVRMDAAAGNDMRRAATSATPVVRLSEHVEGADPDSPRSPGDALPRTGRGTDPLAAVALVAAGAVGAGLALATRRREHR